MHFFIASLCFLELFLYLGSPTHMLFLFVCFFFKGEENPQRQVKQLDWFEKPEKWRFKGWRWQILITTVLFIKVGGLHFLEIIVFVTRCLKAVDGIVIMVV